MIEIEALSVKAPHIDAVAVISVGTSSARTNLAATAQLGTLCTQGKYINLVSDADCYFAFNSSDAGAIDETATAGSTRCYALKAGVQQSVVLTKGFTWLLHKAPVATLIRAYVSSFDGEGN